MVDPVVETKTVNSIRRNMKKFYLFQVFSLTVVFLLVMLGIFSGNTSTVKAAELCGNGNAPDYGFNIDLQQPHWTVGSLVSEEAKTEVDTILDRLNADNIAQTMILIQPAEQVGNRVNCAVHFLRYMQLGQPTGAHKDNGFTFLFVVESGKIDVHYGVGLGLPALTAANLTPINRLAEETYKQTGSLDVALVETIKAFDAYARSKYTADPSAPESTSESTTPFSMWPFWQQCLCILSLIILVAILVAMGPSSPSGSSRNNGGGGVGKSPSVTRGGSGSGKSGRGN